MDPRPGTFVTASIPKKSKPVKNRAPSSSPPSDHRGFVSLEPKPTQQETISIQSRPPGEMHSIIRANAQPKQNPTTQAIDLPVAFSPPAKQASTIRAITRPTLPPTAKPRVARHPTDLPVAISPTVQATDPPVAFSPTTANSPIVQPHDRPVAISPTTVALSKKISIKFHLCLPRTATHGS